MSLLCSVVFIKHCKYHIKAQVLIWSPSPGISQSGPHDPVFHVLFWDTWDALSLSRRLRSSGAFLPCSALSHALVPLWAELCRRWRDSEGSSSLAPLSPLLAAGEDTGWVTTRLHGTSWRSQSLVCGLSSWGLSRWGGDWSALQRGWSCLIIVHAVSESHGSWVLCVCVSFKQEL